MKGDFSRVTFNPANHFSRVLMQQGRVQLDADFNEQSAILLHYVRTLVADMLGPYFGPVEGAGFKVEKMMDRGTFSIGTGRYYVDGLLIENDNPNGAYTIDEIGSDRRHALYLDVWERHVNHLQAPHIREVALGGPDTCARAQVVWAIRHEDVTGSAYFDNVDPPDGLEAWIAGKRKREGSLMGAKLTDTGQNYEACSISPESRYRRAENQLYRIEVHREGKAWTEVKVEGGAPGGNASAAATFKWSRDNGSVVFPIVRKRGDVVHLEYLGQDQRTSLGIDDWVEIIDDGDEREGVPGVLAQVAAVDPVELSVRLKSYGASMDASYDEKSATHPLLRRWDHRAVEGQSMSEGAILLTSRSDSWIEIEDGIEIRFQLELLGDLFRSGDYWLIPARVANGDIEWPKDGGKPRMLAPAGITHYFAPLAVVDDGEPTDCRRLFRA